MIEIAVHDLHKYYGSNHVLRGVTFEIYSGEKIGLLGKNGSGKTTLFKIIASDEHYESGSVSKAKGKKVEILDQIPVFAENETVEDILRSSFSEVISIHDKIKKLEGDSNPAVLKQYGKLMDEYEMLGGYDVDVKIEKICNGMTIGSDMRQTPFSLLSGGEKTRVNLARILLRDGDVLLLDEPTNHLDLSSLEWLENFLRQFSGSVVVVSHDRVFLDKIITRVIEIDNGKAHFYSGNYSWYADEKQRRYITQAEQYARQQKEIKRIEERAKWLVEQNRFTTKHHAILSRIDHIDKVEKPTATRKLEEEFNSGGYAAKQILSLESVSKKYGANLLLNDVSLTIWKNDRIAIIGANGCGKTTLFKLIMNEESCDSGVVKISSNVKIAYMPQIITFENENATVLETMQCAIVLTEEKIRSILASYRFKSADILKKVVNLSGGEKSRLKLCLLMQNKVNLLILDEPTNHLDIESKEWIEDAVSDFDGTMIFISHDRYFLNKFASRIWSMKDGNITDFHGSFDDYVKASLKVESHSDKTHATKKKKKILPVNTKEKPAKSVPWETIINETESELSIINDEIESGFPHTDYQKLNWLCQQKQLLEERLEFLYSQWIGESENAHQKTGDGSMV